MRRPRPTPRAPTVPWTHRARTATVLTGLLGAAQAGTRLGHRLHLGPRLAVVLFFAGAFALLSTPVLKLDENVDLIVVFRRAGGAVMLLGLSLPALVLARWKGAPPHLAARAFGLGMGGAAGFASASHLADRRRGGRLGMLLGGALAVVGVVAIASATPLDRSLVAPGVFTLVLLAVGAWDSRGQGAPDGSWTMAAFAAVALLSAGLGGLTDGIDAAQAAEERSA
jgi:hypothetical protein